MPPSSGPEAPDPDTVERIVEDLAVLLARAERAGAAAARRSSSAADGGGDRAAAPPPDASAPEWAGVARLSASLAEPLTVALVALAKSGKSTLVNALLADDVCPCSNVPETALAATVLHSRASAPPRLFLRAAPEEAGGAGAGEGEGEEEEEEEAAPPDAVGARAVRERLAALHRERRGALLLPPPLQPPPAVRIVAPIAALSTSASAGLAAAADAAAPGAAPAGGGPSLLRLAIVDTPGANEAGGGEELRREVETRVLPRADAVVYLLDYTKLRTRDEQAVLSRLAELRPGLLARLCCDDGGGGGAHGRLFFVVNKADQADEALGGLPPDETRAYVAELLTSTLRAALLASAAEAPGRQQEQREQDQEQAPAALTVLPSQVLLISARDALLGRLVLSGRAEPEHLRAFSRVAFGSAGLASPQPSSSSSPPSPSPQTLEAARRLVAASGVAELERRVLASLALRAAPLKRLAALEAADALALRAGNVWAARLAALGAGEAARARQRAALERALGGIIGLAPQGGPAEGEGGAGRGGDDDGDNDELAAVLAQSEELQRRAAAEMRDRLAWVRTLLFQRLTDALEDGDEDGGNEEGGGEGAGRAADGNTNNNDNNGGGDEGDATTTAAARWRDVRARFLALMRHDGGVVSAARAGPAHVEVVVVEGRRQGGAADEQEEPGGRRDHYHRRRRRHGCCARRRHRSHRHRQQQQHHQEDDEEDESAPLARRGSVSSELSALSSSDGQEAAAASSSAAAASDPYNNNNIISSNASDLQPPPADARARERAGAALLDLHEAAMRAVSADVREAWPALEGAAMAHAARLSADINAALARLSRRVERAVEEAAEAASVAAPPSAADAAPALAAPAPPQPPPLRLDPGAPVRLPAPSPESFHADLTAMLLGPRDGGGVLDERRERHTVTRETTGWGAAPAPAPAPPPPSTGRPRRRCGGGGGFGLCRLLRQADLFCGGGPPPPPHDAPPAYAPPLRLVTTRARQTFNAATVRVDAAALRAHLLTAVEAACAASEAAVERSVRLYASGRVAEARRAAAAYASAYLEALGGGGDVGTGDFGSLPAARQQQQQQQQQQQLAELEALRRRVRAARAAEEAPPHAAPLDLLMADCPPPPPAPGLSPSPAPSLSEEGTEEGAVASASADDVEGGDWALLRHPPGPAPPAP